MFREKVILVGDFQALFLKNMRKSKVKLDAFPQV